MQFLTHSNSPCLALAECGYPRPPFFRCQAGQQQTPLFGNKLRCEGLESVQTQSFLTLSSYSPHSYDKKFSIQTLNEQTRACKNTYCLYFPCYVAKNSRIQVLSNPKAKIFVCNLPDKFWIFRSAQTLSRGFLGWRSTRRPHPQHHSTPQVVSRVEPQNIG